MRPTISGGKQIHIGCARDDLAENLLLPGDPDRVAKIARARNQVKEIRREAEHLGSFMGIEHVDIEASS